MKESKPSVLDFITKSVLVFVLLYISICFDKFSFGMMDIKNSISFGISVALFCGSNLIFAYLIINLIKSITKK